jgi:hypothetical protein
MNRRSPLVALGTIAVLGLVVLGVDRVAPPATPADADTAEVATPTPVSGAWACPVGDGRDGSTLELVAARPGGTGGQAGLLELQVLDDGQVTTTSLPDLFPTADVRRSPSLVEGAAVAARWAEAPVTLAREWRLSGEDDLPAGTISGPCIQPFADRWVVPGMSTVGSERARIRLANPFAADATVAISFLVPEGREEPLALRNLTVPARATLEVAVNDHLPEREDLAAVVEVAAGRVAAEGYQVVDASIGDVDGATLLAAAPQAAETWTVPWVADGDGRSSWLWVANPSDRTAAVELTMHTSDGGVVPTGLAEVSVPPGTLRRVDLSETLPEEAGEVALTARSEGVPVYVSGALVQAGEGPEATGFAVQLGAPTADRSWVVSGRTATERTERLRLVNPGGEPATVDVELFTGNTVERPDGLQGIEVPAGAAVDVALTDALAGLDGWSAFVTADQDIVVGRVGSGGEDALHLVATLGMPSSSWRPQVAPLAGEREAGLVTRLRTALGIQPEEPFGDVDGDDPTVPGPDADPDPDPRQEPPVEDGPEPEPLPDAEPGPATDGDDPDGLEPDAEGGQEPDADADEPAADDAEGGSDDGDDGAEAGEG